MCIILSNDFSDVITVIVYFIFLCINCWLFNTQDVCWYCILIWGLRLTWHMICGFKIKLSNFKHKHNVVVVSVM